MITLEEYKKYLTSTYIYEYDNTKEKYHERTATLKSKYHDEYLAKIIIDTYKVIKLLESVSDPYYNISIDENTPEYITLNLIGGWHSDTIYKDNDDNLISIYILKRHFGNMLIAETKIIEREFETDDPDILSFDYEYYLYIQGFHNQNKIKQKIKK